MSGEKREASGGSGKLVEASACSGADLKQNSKTHLWFLWAEGRRKDREEFKGASSLYRHWLETGPRTEQVVQSTGGPCLRAWGPAHGPAKPADCLLASGLAGADGLHFPAFAAAGGPLHLLSGAAPGAWVLIIPLCGTPRLQPVNEAEE